MSKAVQLLLKGRQLLTGEVEADPSQQFLVLTPLKCLKKKTGTERKLMKIVPTKRLRGVLLFFMITNHQKISNIIKNHPGKSLQNLRISNKSNKIFSNITFTQFPTCRRCRSSAAWLPAWPPASAASRRASCDWVSCNFARSEVVSCLPRAAKAQVLPVGRSWVKFGNPQKN